MGTFELQKEIENIISQFGWSRKKFARVIYTELNEVDDEEEIRKFEERLKKHLTRKTTSVDKLKGYIKILSQQTEFGKIDMVLNRYEPTQSISPFLVKKMENISKGIDEKLK